MGFQRFLVAMALLLCGNGVQAQDVKMPMTISTAEYSGVQRLQIEGLVREYSEKIKIDSTNLKLYEARAMFNLTLQQYELAIKDLDRLISKKQDHASWYYFRGICKLSLHDMDRACVDLKKARELNYDFNSSELLMFCNY